MQGLVRSGAYTQLMAEVRRRYDGQQRWRALALAQPSEQGATCITKEDLGCDGGDNVVTVAVHMRRGDLVGVDEREGGDAGYYRVRVGRVEHHCHHRWPPRASFDFYQNGPSHNIRSP